MEKDTQQPNEIATILERLDAIESQLETDKQKAKEEKGWKDLIELGGLILMIAAGVYLFMNGGFKALLQLL